MKIIAFYLPQFHEIEENNKWWGKGFTEWTNVKKSKAIFTGHNQPRIPLNNNYYDLADIEVMKWQSKIAKEYGIYGFCYYHYWFNGKKLLEKPLEQMLQNNDVEMPFCLSWANEPWTRTWDGLEKNILMPQIYGGIEEWHKHYAYLANYFKDNRYIKINNRPVFLLYRSESIKNVDEMIQCWEELALQDGFAGIFCVETLTGIQHMPVTKNSKAVVQFEPMYTFSNNKTSFFQKKIDQWYRKFVMNGLKTRSYNYIWKRIIQRKIVLFENKKTFLGAFVDWDNSPRRAEKGLCFRGVDIQKFKLYFQKQLEKAKKMDQESFVFINAWNEWAEGTYLEPDEYNGYSYLEAIKNSVERVK
ncbi:glycoside hydrolase family 99-like domain-containing protein [Sulfuricurvum sp.]|uniref:glycosyltransferase WbsX family protein n=1 Tax=Sulfuricurvum sp. TaxID=2025608 RepID=UPI002625C3A2|nr:glycoside hydrolase family 99-like domain-containing protein [Sulfuricurvum sp.]MDD3596885.1 glycoside hydrolase family 99-like domain-containing protein [Sulfuricurvum sp.]